MNHACDHLPASATPLRSSSPRPSAGTKWESRIRTRQRGFTLIELVMVIIIVGVLAAVAVPKFIAMGRDARLVSLQTLASALRSTAENVHALCSMAAGCDYGNASQTLQIAGRPAWLNYGWLDSGDNLEGNQIDAWVTHTGFTTTIPTPSNTLFTLDGSPDPSNCSVNYFDAYHRGAAAGVLIVSTTAGC